jgi:hypothetical protein
LKVCEQRFFIAKKLAFGFVFSVFQGVVMRRQNFCSNIHRRKMLEAKGFFVSLLSNLNHDVEWL